VATGSCGNRDDRILATVSPQGNGALSVNGDPGRAPEIARDVVIATDLIEIRPASWAGRLAWAQNSRRRPKHFDVYLREGGGVEQRVNASGTEGVPGGLDDTTLAYYVFTDTDAKNPAVRPSHADAPIPSTGRERARRRLEPDDIRLSAVLSASERYS
jgi:hypothetical protein